METSNAYPATILSAIEECYGIGFGEASVAACRLLGFARMTEDMQAVAERRRDFLLARGRIEQRGEMLFSGPGSTAQT